MPVPKRKVSKRNQRSRRAQDRLSVPHHVRTCPQCGEPVLMHCVCTACGFYKGKEVLTISME